ncbi:MULTISPECIES: hypothetical protein [unclassified Exiguobacterium]|uniref:hypothetical protein n=1 Tax=unclassified Exiguobacterium TaxID=2644629 RepID=UPI001BEBEAD4|nr:MULTISPECIES: hypothetical protein [unclassified Exiguobacterium]
MKWVVRLILSAGLLALCVIGMVNDNMIMVALSLSLPYLIGMYLSDRFENRLKKIRKMAFAIDKEIDSKETIPFTIEGGVYFFQEKDMYLIEHGDYTFTVSEMKPNLVKDERVRRMKLEKVYATSIYETRYYLLFSQLLSLSLALFMAVTEGASGYFIIPVALGLYNILAWTEVYSEAFYLDWVDKQLNNPKPLKALMTMYVRAILNEARQEETDVLVLPTGDVVVSFLADSNRKYYFVPYDDLVAFQKKVIFEGSYKQ